MWAALITGIAIGALVAAQVGPIWLWCARTAARWGFAAGAAIGAGAAAVDTAYAALGAFGATALLSDEPWPTVLGVVGAAVLARYAWRALRDALRYRAAGRVEDAGPAPTRAGFRSAVVLTAANPLTILSWTAIFGGAAVLPLIGSTADVVALLIGVGTGSLAWHLLLSIGFGRLGAHLSPRMLAIVDALSGAGLAVFAVLLAAGALRGLSTAG